MPTQPTLFENVLYLTPGPLLAVGILMVFAAAFFLGKMVAHRLGYDTARNDTQRFLLDSAIGVLALLMGFTFSMAIDRFDSRRRLIVEEAAAVTSAYTWALAIQDVDAARVRAHLMRYVEARLAAAESEEPAQILTHLARGERSYDQLLSIALVPARVTPNDVSAAFLESVQQIATVGAERVAARRGHVPTRVYGVLLVILALVAFGLGHEAGARSRSAPTWVLVLLLTSGLSLIVSIDRPLGSAIGESQRPLEEALVELRLQPSTGP